MNPTFDTISALITSCQAYDYVNFQVEAKDKKELGTVITIIKALKDGMYYYYNQLAPEGVTGKRTFALVMTECVKEKSEDEQ